MEMLPGKATVPETFDYYYYYYYKCHGLQCCSCGGTLQNLDIKMLHSSMQTVCMDAGVT